ncbi:MAG: XdhC family protein [Dehalococcoidia bacterium]|nr:XdhC family protein [Dehalococcoidia bacterium]
MNDVYEALARAIRTGERVAVATVAHTRGSTPRRAGAKMLIRADGSFCGTIGGGCGEAEVRIEAMAIVQGGAARVVTVDLTNEIDGPDKICGGVMEVYIEPVDPFLRVDNAGTA